MAPFFLWGVLFLTIPVLVLLIDSAVESAAKGITAASRPAVRRALYASAVGWWFGRQTTRTSAPRVGAGAAVVTPEVNGKA